MHMQQQTCARTHLVLQAVREKDDDATAVDEHDEEEEQHDHGRLGEDLHVCMFL